jgi:Carboxypeptidase regulatory-like domain
MRVLWLRSLVVLGFATNFLVSVVSAAAPGPKPTAVLGVTSSSSLPDAPLPQFSPQTANGQSSSAEGAAALSGVVLDASGAAIPGAQVSLAHGDGRQTRRVSSGSQGEFVFTGLPAGSYLITINAKGFAPSTSTQIDLGPQQVYQVSNLTLSVGSIGTEVTVRPTEVIAAEQIKAEEKQRFIGVIPNFYTSYVHDPAPMTTRQKFSLASRDSFDPVSLIADGVVAGIQQANDTSPGYGYGAAGYGKRFAAQFGDGRTSDFLSHAVFPALFHQDPRYFYQGTGSFNSRLIHAASFAIITRSDSGKPMPNYSYFLGDIGSGALSNLYYPHADRGIGLVFTNAAIGIAGKAGGAILREFFSKRITTNVPPAGTP